MIFIIQNCYNSDDVSTLPIEYFGPVQILKIAKLMAFSFYKQDTHGEREREIERERERERMKGISVEKFC